MDGDTALAEVKTLPLAEDLHPCESLQEVKRELKWILQKKFPN
jgi:hypothetical protein